ncbi:ABC transporter permease [Faecalimonas umbilicata]|uniref:ABC transporter permease n=1 Tax=Faecalimonas umbilicata TaxID=1912855 RepID=UPI0014028EB5|nr:ABC transporter permease [Faecalimonas umbilicata]
MISKIINCDFYRIKKSKLFYGAIILSGLVALSLMLLNRQDIRLGISIFGNLTTFISSEDVINLGVTYQKGLGLIIAIVISVFIGQEYQWNTWQYKWLISKTRIGMYLSKALLSAIISTVIFLLFELTALLFSGQFTYLLENGFTQKLICGAFIYAALGSVLCMISVLIKNSTASIIVSLGYVLCDEMIMSVMQNITRVFPAAKQIISIWSNHTIYGMSVSLCNSPASSNIIMSTLVTSICISFLAILIGIWRFRKYEL